MDLNLPLLPLRDIVVFPGMIVPLFVGRDKSVVALEKRWRRTRKFSSSRSLILPRMIPAKMICTISA